MASGDLSPKQRVQLDRAIRAAEQASRFEFSIFRGVVTGDPREFAQGLHAALAAPERSVLLVVDPVAHILEVVTGAEVRRQLTDPEVELAIVAMESAFREGDEVGGLTRGLALLAEHAIAPRTLHARN